MTTDEINIAKALSNCSLLPNSFNKRFIRSIASMAENKPEQELTEKQVEWLYRLLYTYRKQIPIIYYRFPSNPLCCKLLKK